MYLVLLFSAKLILSKASTHILSQTYDRLSFQEATGNYVDSRFLSTHSVYPASYESTGDKAGYNVEFAFQDDGNYWVSRDPNTDNFHSSIIITFSEPTTLEAFLLSAAYKSGDKGQNIREYHGFPTKMKVYISLNDNDDFILNTIFSGTPTYPLETAQYVFKNLVACKRLKLEFAEVTEDYSFSDGAKATSIRYLNFIKHLSYSDLQYQFPSGNYDYSLYVDFHKIPKNQFDYESSSDYDGYSIDNAFDDKNDNYWIANDISDGSSKSHIIITFKKQTFFEGFHFKGRYYKKYVFPSYRDFYPGMPTKLNLYVSNGTNEFVLHTKFSGDPSDKKDFYQYILSEKVLCDRIKIEFVEVIKDEDKTNSQRVVVDQITLFQGFENEELKSEDVYGNYADSSYLSTRTVSSSVFSLTATGGSQNSHDISTTTTDDDASTYWVSSIANSDTFHNCVNVEFKKTVSLEAILIDPVFKTEKKIHVFSGFPLRLKVYSSLNNEELKLISTFSGVPGKNTEKVQFVLPNIVECTKLQLEFVDVTPFKFDSDGSLYAGAAKFTFVEKQTSDFEVIQYHSNTGYQQLRVIPSSKFSYKSTGYKESCTDDNLFDDNDGDKSYWESSFDNDDSHHASIFINFTQPIKLEELVLGAYKGTYKNSGFPLELNLYASNDDNEELELKATFKGNPDKSVVLHQFTLRQPISCTRLQIEFVSILETGTWPVYYKAACLTCMKIIGEIVEFSSGNLQDDFVTQYVNKSYPLSGLNDTSLVVNDLPVDNDYLFVIEKKFYFDNVNFTCPDAQMSAIKGNQSNQIVVKSCKFDSCSVKSSIGSGGAILSINCVLKCETSNFVNCHSKENGGGGGISISLNQKINEDITIFNCKFSKCSATFGGAVYLYSNVDSNAIVIKKCSFVSNSLIEPSSSSSDADLNNGGSAIYLHAMKASVKFCKFEQNSGLSAVKVNNDFENTPSLFSRKILFGSSVVIDNCEFEINSMSKSSLSYVRGKKKAVETVVSNCVFTGQLLNGAHHIFVDSKMTKDEKPKLNIKSCKFACDRLKSINLSFDNLSNSLVVFNLNNQVFDNDGNYQKVANKSNSKALFIAVVSLTFVAILALIATIVTVSMKKSDDKENDDKNDALNLPLDATDL